jgi:hypothetical protein
MTQGNIQLPSGVWVSTLTINDKDYVEALSIGIAELIKQGKINYNDIKAAPKLGRKPNRLK